MAVGRRACPSRQLRRRSTAWSSSVSAYMSSNQAPSRLKQIDGRSCTGNVNLLQLGWPTSPFAEPRRSARHPRLRPERSHHVTPAPARPGLRQPGGTSRRSRHDGARKRVSATTGTRPVGDVYPTTVQGRIVAMVVMLVGIGFLSVLTATIASHFVKSERGNETTEIMATLKRVEAELAELRRQLARP
jgi:hypothetical protein